MGAIIGRGPDGGAGAFTSSPHEPSSRLSSSGIGGSGLRTSGPPSARNVPMTCRLGKSSSANFSPSRHRLLCGSLPGTSTHQRTSAVPFSAGLPPFSSTEKRTCDPMGSAADPVIDSPPWVTFLA
jgi:hypothetical protein